MTRRKRAAGLMSALATVAVMLTGCGSSNSGSDGSGSSGSKSPIVIGASLSLSGDFAADGQAFQRGCELWAADVNRHLTPPRMPRPSGRGGIGPLRSGARKDESPSGRFVVSTHRAEGGLQQVDDLRVERPPVDAGLLNKALVQVCWQAERDPLLKFHARIMP